MAEIEDARPAPLPIGKKIAFAMIAIGIALILLEGISWLVLNHTSVVARKTSVWRNAESPDHEIIVPEELSSRFNGSLVSNVTEIFLNRADSKFIFRVREPGPEDTDLRRMGVNTLGFRGPEFDLFELPERRVLLVGDSCGFGWGVWNLADTIAGRLEALLNDGGVTSRIYNISQGGFSSFQCALMFDEWYDRIKPQVIIFYLGWNDIHRTWITDRQASEILSRVNVSSATWYRKANLYKLFDGLAYTAKVRLLEKVDATGTMTRRVPADQSMKNLRHMIDRGRADGCTSIIIVPPFAHSRSPLIVAADADPPPLTHMVEFREVLEKEFRGEQGIYLLKFPVIDHERPEGQRFYQADGYHPNEAGCLVIAQGIQHAIREIAIFPPPEQSP